MSCCCCDNLVYKGETLELELTLLDDDGETPIVLGENDDIVILFSGQPAGSLTTAYKLSTETLDYDSTTGVVTVTVSPTESAKLDGAVRIEIKVIKDDVTLIGTQLAFECVEDNVRRF